MKTGLKRLTGLLNGLLIILVLSLSSPALGKELRVGFILGAGGLGDQSFNDATYAGLARAQQSLNVHVVLEDPANDDLSREAAFVRMIAKRLNVIVINGGEFNDLVKDYAAKNPKVRFIVNDNAVSGLANVVSTVFAQHEGSFLAGALAAMVSQTRKVGFIGGVEMDVIHAFRVGFVEGVQHVDDQVQVVDKLVSPRGDFSGFQRPDLGFQIADQMYSEGVDIIFSVAGLTGNGVIHSAQKNKKYVIGVDTDQDHMAKGYVLTSMMKRLDNATYNEIYKITTGEFTPGVQYYDLQKGGVSLTPMKFTRHLLPPLTLERLETIKSNIISGKIKVTDYMAKEL